MPPIFINGGFYISDTRKSLKYCEEDGNACVFFCYRVRRHEPLNGGGGNLLFDTSDLQMLLKLHDFPVFFSQFLCKSYICNAFVGKLEIPKFTVGRNICLFRSLLVRACRTAGLGGSSLPLTF